MSTNFMLLRNGKRKYNILRTNQNDNNSFKNFYGIKIFDKDYYICGIQPFNSNELKQLITINCTAREKTKYRETRRGGYMYPVTNQSVQPLFYSIGDQQIIDLIGKCFIPNQGMNVNAIKQGMQYRLLILLRMLQRYFTYGVITNNESQQKKYPWREYVNENQNMDCCIIERPTIVNFIDISNESSDDDINHSDTISIKQEQI